MTTIGIDLGTTNSLVAYADGEGVRLIPNARGRFGTPSVIGIDASGDLLVGEAAANQLSHSPDRTVAQIKRQMGRRTTMALGSERRSPEELSAIILASLRRQSAEFLGQEPLSVVITVPAHFGDQQRLATYEAALLAGFRRVQLINEPTAAALPYAVRDGSHERIVVFDFGGGTLDATCLERDGADFAVRATNGDGALGGLDIDRLLAGRITSRITEQAGELVAQDQRVGLMALQLAERAKIDLSEVQRTEINLPFLGPGAPHVSFSLERRELEELIQPMAERALRVLQRTVRDAGFDRDGFDRLVLAGGSSRIPLVRAALQEAFPAAVADRINPEEVIARGAALYASRENGDGVGGFGLRDVLSGTLAIELADGTCVPLVRRNQTVPVSRSRLFTTVSDEQDEAEIHLVQGNHRQAWRNRSLGRFVLPGIHRARQGEPRIAVTVDVSTDGIVTVRAGDRDSGSSQGITARARPAAVPQTISGPRDAYLASLLRRGHRLRAFAEASLAQELSEVTALVEQEREKTVDDLVTVLETLIREIVSGLEQPPERSSSRAAG